MKPSLQNTRAPRHLLRGAITFSLMVITLSAQAQLSGTYTIGPDLGDDYASFTAAVADLNTVGVSGPVVFEFDTGTYNEQVTITVSTADGTSAVNTVTFRPAAAANVVLAFGASGAGDNFIIKLNDADHVHFEDLSFDAQAGSASYGRIFHLLGNLAGIQITDSDLTSENTTSTSTNLAVVFTDNGVQTSDLLLSGNTFTFGSWGAYLDGANTFESTGAQFLDNVVSAAGRGGLYAEYYDGAVFDGNTVQSLGARGVTFSSSDDVVVTDNTITVAAGNGRGLSLLSVDGTPSVLRNRIELEDYGQGVYCSSCNGSFGNYGLFANNFIVTGGTNQGIGFYFISTSSYQQIYHNSVNIASATASSIAFFMNSGSDFDVRNNIFASPGGGYALDVGTATSAIATLDYNDYYTTGPYLANWNGARIDLAALQAANSMDASSISANPSYTLATPIDLTTNSPFVDDVATNLTSIVSDDIDGTARSVPTSLGAYEFTSGTTPLAGGTYVIDPAAGGDYLTLADAFDALENRGIAGAVVFELVDGSHAGPAILRPTAGATASNTIVFKAASGASPLISHAATTASDNFVLQLDGTDYTRFEDLAIQATTPSTSLGRVVYLKGGLQDVRFTGNTFTGRNTTSSSTNLAVVFTVNGVKTTDLLLSGNTFTFGSWGAYLDGANASESTGAQFLDNAVWAAGRGGLFAEYYDGAVFDGNTVQSLGARGVTFSSSDDVVVTDNTITVAAGNGRGLSLLSVDGTPSVLRNRIELEDYGQGVYCSSCNGSFGNYGLFANNFIVTGGTNQGIGFYFISTSSYQQIYHNSVNIASATASSIAFFMNSGSDFDVRNNIFASPGGGYALDVGTATSAIATLDYNDYYTTGPYLANWNGARIDLAALQAANSMDASSISANPSYTLATPIDLTTNSPFVDDVATNLTSIVSDDIDGTARSVPTSLGAYEFTSGTTPLAGGTYVIDPAAGGDYLTLADAFDALENRGIAGAVVFELVGGSHVGGATLFPVAGASASNDIFFMAATGVTPMVAYSAAAASDNFVIGIDGADYVRFQDLAFQATTPSTSLGRVVYLKGGLQDVRFAGNTFTGRNTTSSSTDLAVVFTVNGVKTTDLLLSGNTFTFGSWGAYLDGANASESTGAQFLDNAVWAAGRGGLFAEYYDGAVFDGNTVQSLGARGVTFSSSDDVVVTDNTITVAAGNGRGLSLLSVDGTPSVLRNRIELENYGQGVYCSSCNGSFGNYGLFANNFIVTGGANQGIGFYFISTSSYQQIYHNSVNIASATASSIAFFMNSGSDFDVRNNIFASPGGGYALDVGTATSAIATLDYNDYYTTGPYLANWNGDRVDLTALQTANGMDANSISVDPAYGLASNLDLTTNSPSVDATGVDLSSTVATDIDLRNRSLFSPHDLGAYAYTSGTTQLGAGTYVIDPGGGGDYLTLAEASAALESRGIAGAVVFEFVDGPHAGPAILRPTAGASGSNTIVFKAASGASPLVSYAATTTSDNFVLQLDGADYVRFQDLAFQATTPSTSLGRVVYLKGGLQDVQFSGNTLTGRNTTSSSTDLAVLFTDNATQTTDLLLSGNTFTLGSWGAYLDGATGVESTGAQILNNVVSAAGRGGLFAEYYDGAVLDGNTVNSLGARGVTFSSSDDVVVTDNTITVAAGNGRGLSLLSVDGTPSVLRNRIELEDYGQGVYCSSCNGSFGNYGLFANNFIVTGGTNQGIGFYFISTSSYQRIYHNSVNIASATASSIAFHMNSGSDFDVRNNIFASPGGGYALNVGTATSAIATLDYNDYYTTGPNLANWNGDRTNLAALKAANGMDANSISVNPGFNLTSALDLTTDSPSMDGGGVAGTGVTDDIDGRIRGDLSPVDLGAYAFDLSIAVEMVSFTGLVEEHDVVLAWSVASETNNAGFEVLFAKLSGAVDRGPWQLAGFVEGNGTSTEAVTYSFSVTDLEYSRYVFRLKQIDTDGGISYTDEIEITVEMIEDYILGVPYPNPSNSRAQFTIAVREQQDVRVELYDALGRHVRTLLEGELPANETQRVQVDASALASGLYFARITADRFADVRTFMVVK